MDETKSLVRLLRISAAVMIVLGSGLVIWLLDTALLHPREIVSTRMPFWIPFTVTVLIGLGFLTFLFLRAASRVRDRSRRGQQQVP